MLAQGTTTSNLPAPRPGMFYNRAPGMGQAQSIQPQSQGTPYGQRATTTQTATSQPKQGGAYSAWQQGQQGGYSAWQQPQQASYSPQQSQWNPQQFQQSMQGGGNTYNTGIGQQNWNQSQSAWSMPKQQLMQWGSQLPQSQPIQPLPTMNQFGQMPTQDLGQIMQQRMALVQQINDAQANQEVGTYLGQGEPPPNWGQMQINPQQMWNNAQQMVQQGWQNPFAPQAPQSPQADSIRNLFAQNNIQAPQGFMDQLLGMLGQQAPQPQLQQPMRQPQLPWMDEMPYGGTPRQPAMPSPWRNPAEDFVDTGFGLQVLRRYRNPQTGETFTAPDSGVQPRPGTGWEPVYGGSPGTAQPIQPPSRGAPYDPGNPRIGPPPAAAEALSANPEASGMANLQPIGYGKDALGNSLHGAQYAVRPDEAKQFNDLGLGMARVKGAKTRSALLDHAEHAAKNPSQYSTGYLQALKTAVQHSGSTMRGKNPDAAEAIRKQMLMRALEARANGQEFVVRDALSPAQKRRGFREEGGDYLREMGLGVQYRNRPS